MKTFKEILLYSSKGMEFNANKNKRINSNSIAELNKAKIVNLVWRYQKNSDNDQVISYAKDCKCGHIVSLNLPKEHTKEQHDC